MKQTRWMIALATLALGGCSPNWNSEDYFETATVEDVINSLRSGADINARDQYGNTPLHKAAGYGSPSVVTALLDSGADFNARDVYGYKPLHEAAQGNPNPAVTVALLDAGADVNAVSGDGDTPLHFANDESVIAVLLDAGADVNARNDSGSTPLHWAGIDFFEGPNPAAATLLLKAGADPQVRNDEGETPLHIAASVYSDGDLATMAALLDAGADINARNESGQTPLHKAASYNENPALIAALLNAGADPDASDEHGQTSLHVAAEESFDATTVAVLLDAGADPNVQDRWGQTPLHMAAQLGFSPDIVTALLDAGADPNVRDQQGETPLDPAEYNPSQQDNDAYRLLSTALEGALIGAGIWLMFLSVGRLRIWFRRKTHSREANTSSPRTARPTVHARQEADLASPLPDDLIAEGREFMATAEGATEANRILAEYGLPNVGEQAIYQSDVFSEDGRVSRSTPERVVVLDAIPSEEYMSGESTPPAVTIWRDGTTFELILPLSGEALTPFQDRS